MSPPKRIWFDRECTCTICGKVFTLKGAKQAQGLTGLYCSKICHRIGNGRITGEKHRQRALKKRMIEEGYLL